MRSWKYRNIPSSTLRANLAALQGSSWVVRWLFEGTMVAINAELKARDLAENIQAIAEDSDAFAVAAVEGWQ